MDATSIIYLLQRLGVSNTIVKGDEVYCPCPFSAWTHAGGTDTHPSFSVKISVGRSVYNCFTCGERGSLNTLVWEMSKRTNCDWKALKQFIRQCEGTGVYDKVSTLGSYGDKYVKRKNLPVMGNPWEDTPLPKPQSVEFDGKTLVSTDPKVMFEENKMNEPARFMRERGLDDSVLTIVQLGYNYKYDVVVIPIYNMEEVLVGCGYRQNNREPKYLYSRGCPIGETMFLEHVFWKRPHPDRRVILVEGFFDALKLWQWGYNAMSILGSSFGESKASKLSVLRSRGDVTYDVYVMLDGDKPGQDAEHKMIHGDPERRVTGLKARFPVYGCGLQATAAQPHYDPGDFKNKDEVERALKGAQFYE